MSSIAIRRAAPANPVNSTSSTSAQVFNLVSNAAVPVTVVAPGHLVLEGKRFTVRAEGSLYSAGATTTVKASLLGALTIPATPLTATNWTLLGSGTARTVDAAWCPWWISADLIFDSNGGALQGVFDQMLNNLYDARAAITNQVTGINGTNSTISQAGTAVPPAEPAVVFAVALTFNTAGANIGNLANFEVGF